MATLAERSLNTTSRPPAGVPARESGGWGLMLIPILLCVAMLVFATVSSALPAQGDTSSDRTCGHSYEPRPVAGC